MKFRNSAKKCSLGNLMFYQIRKEAIRKKRVYRNSVFFLYSVIFSDGI